MHGHMDRFVPPETDSVSVSLSLSFSCVSHEGQITLDSYVSLQDFVFSFKNLPASYKGFLSCICPVEQYSTETFSYDGSVCYQKVLLDIGSSYF